MTFAQFYPSYLAEHATAACRRLHFLGSTAALAAVGAAILTAHPWWLAAAPLVGYGCAWIGHVAFEHNRPATLRHPLYSFLGDWVMFRDMLAGRIRW